MTFAEPSTPTTVPAAATGGGWAAAARGLALFLGGFPLLNVLGELRSPNFDANFWWIDLHPLPSLAGRVLLSVVSLSWLAYAIRPQCGRWRQRMGVVLTAVLILAAARNVVVFYLLVGRRAISAGIGLPFSLATVLTLGILLAAQWTNRSVPAAWRNRLVTAGTLLAAMIGFPLLQMYCFGKTSYHRQADAIVVFGARTHADGHPSNALADRVATACSLYRDGYARTLIFSGGPGDGAVHETQAMRTLAMQLGVQDQDILLDPDGVNTDATVRNTSRCFAERGIRSVLAVSHFYHLPRIKMAYQRAGWNVYTVPAQEQQTLGQLPFFMMREVAALWVYYLSPLTR